MSKLLLINDLAGYGKVALSAMIPILSHMQYEVCSLPTALVSNTLDYGKFEILETTSYMKNTLQVWDALGFQFDAVSTGFIVSRPQTELVRDFCRAQKAKGTRIFTDPIMGDEGKLYNGIGEETVALMRELIATADYIVPNYTEATYLAGVPYQCGGTTREELYAHNVSVLPAVKADGQPVVTFYGAAAQDIDLVYLEDIGDVYVDYDRVKPQIKLDYILTEGDGYVSYELDTAYNFEFTVTTQTGEDKILVVSERSDVK